MTQQKSRAHVRDTTRENPLHPNAMGKTAIPVDLPEEKRGRLDLQRARKMEALGSLASAIAHDFNNILTLIICNADSLRNRLLETDLDAHDELEGITKAVEQGACLTHQLLSFSRNHQLELHALDLNALVIEASKMLQFLIGEGIELTTRLYPALGHVEIDASQIQQVIINLTLNARDAMPSGGKLLIETANVDLDENTSCCLDFDVHPGPYVVLSISDTGVGMTEDTRVRIFEPFFTTKEVGQGTGLGLSTVLDIVKQTDGYVSVSSKLGSGTKFDVYLPRAD